jgi:hypothetical protein
MSTTVRIILRPDFREPLRSQDGFVGRDRELAFLINLLQHRDRATLLVSGHRGVGKSALVDEALRRVEKDEKGRVVVRLSLPHLYHGEVDDRDLRGQILRSLARALYFTVKDLRLKKELAERASSLDSKTYLKELEEHSAIETIAEAEARRSASTRTEVKINPSRALTAVLWNSVVECLRSGWRRDGVGNRKCSRSLVGCRSSDSRTRVGCRSRVDDR